MIRTSTWKRIEEYAHAVAELRAAMAERDAAASDYRQAHAALKATKHRLVQRLERLEHTRREYYRIRTTRVP